MPKTMEKTLVTPNPLLDTPALTDQGLCYSYEIARGEMGVLSFEPYKSLILPYWAFRTVSIAQKSAQVLWTIFESYVERGDLVGADMTRSSTIKCRLCLGGPFHPPFSISTEPIIACKAECYLASLKSSSMHGEIQDDVT